MKNNENGEYQVNITLRDENAKKFEELSKHYEIDGVSNVSAMRILLKKHHTLVFSNAN